jgi:membrane protease YdiL (CAAX protease family)
VVALVALAYAGVAAVGLAIGAARGRPNVFLLAEEDGGALRLAGRSGDLASHLSSLAGGIVLSFVVVAATRWLVRTRPWATALHEDLRPVARALGPRAVLPIAIASSVGEEILFRGALVPLLGVIGSSLLFGLLHQVRGRSRISWAAFATVAGLAFAALFRTTGSLLGPIVAHAAINAANLRFLLRHDPERPAVFGASSSR